MGSSSRLSASMTGDMVVAFLILNPTGLCPPEVKRSVSSVSLLAERVSHRTALGEGALIPSSDPPTHILKFILCMPCVGTF